MISAGRVYAMLGNESLWDVAKLCSETLRAAEVPHAIVGGVAVCLHGYRRNTIDLDLLVRREDDGAIRSALESAGFTWSAEGHEFRSESGVPVQFLLAGDRAGKGSSIRLFDPADEESLSEREELPISSLPRLIEMKIACGLGNARRTHKDLADVVELIAANGLGRDFARFLHRTVRKEFRELVGRASED